MAGLREGTALDIDDLAGKLCIIDPDRVSEFEQGGMP